MFEGLDAVPWKNLAHAYGSAKDVPKWLWQLASSEAHVRQEAINDLGGSLCHQGFLCPATAYAVPFLIELLQEPTVQGKDEILDLLAWIAIAEPFDERPWRKNRTIPDIVVPAHIPFKDAHAAAEAGIPVYISLLDAPELNVRMQAASVLASFPERAQEFWPVLLAAFEREHTERGGANLVLALGKLAGYLPDKQNFFLEQFQTNHTELLAFAAALKMARLAKANTPEEVVQFLADIMVKNPASLNGYQKLACGGGYPWHAAMEALYSMGASRLQYLVPLLKERLAQATGKSSIESLKTVHFTNQNSSIESFRLERFANLLFFILLNGEAKTGQRLDL